MQDYAFQYAAELDTGSVSVLGLNCVQGCRGVLQNTKKCTRSRVAIVCAVLLLTASSKFFPCTFAISSFTVVLQRGLNYAPTSEKVTFVDVAVAVEGMARKMDNTEVSS